SMKLRPSASVMVGPLALWMNSGVPPTPRKARTGELTPPGSSSSARSKSREDLSGPSSGDDMREGYQLAAQLTRDAALVHPTSFLGASSVWLGPRASRPQ